MKPGFTARTVVALRVATTAQAQTLGRAQALEVSVRNNAREEVAIAKDIDAGAIRGRGVGPAEARLALTRTGADSVDLAIRLQQLPNIQDWAIATAQPAL